MITNERMCRECGRWFLHNDVNKQGLCWDCRREEVKQCESIKNTKATSLHETRA